MSTGDVMFFNMSQLYNNTTVTGPCHDMYRNISNKKEDEKSAVSVLVNNS